MPSTKPASSVADGFAARLRGLERARARMERLHAESTVTTRDLEHMYGAIFLAAVALFEASIEDLFLKLLTGRVRLPNPVRPRASFRSDAAARTVVFSGHKYLDWTPYDRTLKRAEVLFYDGRPFTGLTNVEQHTIKRACIIRNAIAHRSAHAATQFRKGIVEQLTLAPRERTPTGFLRSLHSTAPDVTRYEQIVGDLLSISRKLGGK